MRAHGRVKWDLLHPESKIRREGWDPHNNRQNENFAAEIESETLRAEEQLRKRANKFIADAAHNARVEFAAGLSEMQTQRGQQFAEDASVASAEHLAQHAAQLQVVTLDGQEKLEWLTSQINATIAESETRLQAVREDISKPNRQGVEQFREQLRGVLNAQLNALG